MADTVLSSSSIDVTDGRLYLLYNFLTILIPVKSLYVQNKFRPFFPNVDFDSRLKRDEELLTEEAVQKVNP